MTDSHLSQSATDYGSTTNDRDRDYTTDQRDPWGGAGKSGKDTNLEVGQWGWTSCSSSVCKADRQTKYDFCVLLKKFCTDNCFQLKLSNRYVSLFFCLSALLPVALSIVSLWCWLWLQVATPMKAMEALNREEVMHFNRWRQTHSFSSFPLIFLLKIGFWIIMPAYAFLNVYLWKNIL